MALVTKYYNTIEGYIPPHEVIKDMMLLDEMFETDIDGIMQAVSEGYVGKTPTLKKIEALFGELHAMVKGPSTDSIIGKLTPSDIDIAANKLTKSKQIKEINSLFKKQFGFKEFEMNIATSAGANAFTIPRSFITDDITFKEVHKYNKHGEPMYDNEHVMCVYCTTHTYNFRLLTPGEHLAIMLHEVGHNFDVSLSARLAEVMAIGGGALKELNKKDGNVAASIFMSLFFALLKEKIGKYIQRYKNWMASYLGIFEYIESLRGKIMMYINTLKGPWYALNRIKYMAAHPAIAATKAAMALPTIGQEVYSDSFAVAHGYGPELSSALIKLEKDYLPTMRNGITDGIMYDLHFGCVVLGLFFSDHPDILSRTAMNLKNLKALESDPELPAKYRAEVKKQREMAEKIYQDYLKLDPEIRTGWITKLAYFLGDTLFDGQIDLRTYVMGVSACNIPDPKSEARDPNGFLSMVDNTFRGIRTGIRDFIDKPLDPIFKPE